MAPTPGRDVPEALASGRTRPVRTRTAEGPTETYRIPAAMARLVRLRDGSCRFPGCSTPARQCDLDHVRAWPAGPTAPANLMSLCRRHHRIKQRPGWRARIHPDATVIWTDPTGRRLTTRPLDHLHLVTACGTRDTPGAATDPMHGTSLTDALDRMQTLPSTFEEQLHAWLDNDSRHPLRARPHVWAADGTLQSGPPPHVDLDTATGPLSLRGPGVTVVLDHPPPSPAPDVIPF
ncbi:HNH endonuclease signature motif containing protein [Knoellia sp. CPCC 206435]|uniref:HNH endonuclease signature motif containing protein n=1 Tax=Knoellia terrae TaxID=3404797 RepID=UPI003B43780E